MEIAAEMSVEKVYGQPPGHQLLGQVTMTSFWLGSSSHLPAELEAGKMKPAILLWFSAEAEKFGCRPA